MKKTKVAWVLRIILGLLFVYAGVRKVIDPVEFADAIAGFRFAPEALIHPIAMGLPVLEVILGLLIVFPWKAWANVGAFGIILLNIAFIILLVISWIRGLSVECGCFGIGIFPPSRWTLQITIGRDVIFLVMALWVYLINSRHLDKSLS